MSSSDMTDSPWLAMDAKYVQNQRYTLTQRATSRSEAALRSPPSAVRINSCAVQMSSVKTFTNSVKCRPPGSLLSPVVPRVLLA